MGMLYGMQGDMQAFQNKLWHGTAADATPLWCMLPVQGAAGPPRASCRGPQGRQAFRPLPAGWQQGALHRAGQPRCAHSCCMLQLLQPWLPAWPALPHTLLATSIGFSVRCRAACAPQASMPAECAWRPGSFQRRPRLVGQVLRCEEARAGGLDVRQNHPHRRRAS